MVALLGVGCGRARRGRSGLHDEGSDDAADSRDPKVMIPHERNLRAERSISRKITFNPREGIRAFIIVWLGVGGCYWVRAHFYLRSETRHRTGSKIMTRNIPCSKGNKYPRFRRNLMIRESTGYFHTTADSGSEF